MELTHFNEQGRARMVDVSEKAQTFRVARAEATVCMAKATMDKIKEGTIGKGDVLAVAHVAGMPEILLQQAGCSLGIQPICQIVLSMRQARYTRRPAAQPRLCQKNAPRLCGILPPLHEHSC